MTHQDSKCRWLLLPVKPFPHGGLARAGSIWISHHLINNKHNEIYINISVSNKTMDSRSNQSGLHARGESCWEEVVLTRVKRSLALPAMWTAGGTAATDGLISQPLVRPLVPNRTDMATDGTNRSTTSPITLPTTSGSTCAAMPGPVSSKACSSCMRCEARDDGDGRREGGEYL
jgi:hypothetical protein